MHYLKGLSAKFGQSREIVVDIWPETLPAITLFTRLLTQWRTSPTGLIGLDYNALNLLMEYDAIPVTERGALLRDVAALERGYLDALRH